MNSRENKHPARLETSLERPLEERIREKIISGGPVTFETFMEIALYDGEYGYYMSGETRIGRRGDFYTSSHLHPLFGSMIGRQIAEMWSLMGKPESFRLVEIGPGAGHLCRDILDSLEGGEFFVSLEYAIIERNPLMRAKQKELLVPYKDKVRWLSSLDEAGAFRGCVFSNELLDAFPVHLVMMEDELKEIYVDLDGVSLKEKTGPLSTRAISDYFREMDITLEEGYRTEVNLRIGEWIDDIDHALTEGFVFTIDYGYTARDYYSEDRDRGTLLCYYRHQVSEDPLQNIGKQDITAHVNFSALKRWGEEKGLTTVGYCGQGAFLLANGIDAEVARLSRESKDYLSEIGRIKRLILPQGMGESHMVMMQYKGSGSPQLRGFSIRNQMKYL